MAVNTEVAGGQGRTNARPRTFGASFKAGLMGGFAISLLLVIYQISPSFLQTVLIPPALIIVWTVTGIGAAMLCDHRITTSKEGGRVGLTAGIIAGIFGGIAAMIIAAFGVSFVSYGEGIASQVTDTQFVTLSELGFTESLIAVSGSIMTALFTCGIGGMFVAGLLGAFGGWLYPKFSR